MKKKIRSFAVAGLLAVVVFAAALTACGGALRSLDVVGQQSVASFDAVLGAIPGGARPDETGAGWSLAAPDGSARFIWNADDSIGPFFDVMLAFDAKPFLDAGLDPEKLPDNYFYEEGTGTGGLSGGTLMVGASLSGGNAAGNGPAEALESYERVVNNYRDSINYHAELDHYGVLLGDGNMFEWAKDLRTNGTTGENQALDIVFVLNPEPLIAAGVDPAAVEGWAYAPVEMMDNGQKVETLKLLKPFDL